jgi:hypothetical protein
MTCLLTMSSFDLPTHSVSGLLLRYIAPRVEPFQLYGPLARRPFFSAIAPSSDIIIGSGHGSANIYSAEGENVIWQAGQNYGNEIKDKVIKLVSCDTGSELGPDLVKNGCLCYMGFDADLIFIADDSYFGKPWNDPYSYACLSPVISGLQVLLDGQTCGESMAIEKEGFLQNAEQSADFPLLQSSIEFNMQHSILIGNPDATIKPRPRISLPAPPPLLI